MKRICILILLGLLYGCEKTNLDDIWQELNRLKEQLARYELLIDALDKRLYVSQYQQTQDGYTITLSDGAQLKLGSGSLAWLSIGENGNWYIDGKDSGQPSRGENGSDGRDGHSPQISIGNNGNWHIDGQDSGIQATAKNGQDGQNGKDGENGQNGTDGQNGADIISISIIDGIMVFGFSDGRSIALPIGIPPVENTSKAQLKAVFAYVPAPGQFVNILPRWEEGDDAEIMRQKAEQALKSGSMISLGGFGGYVILGLDRSLPNRPGPDFIIHGNALATWAEPGIVMVSRDLNQNGLPDDPWYELAGSEHTAPGTIPHYQISYYAPDPLKAPTPDNDYKYLSDTTHIYWTDNQGGKGYLAKNVYHNQSYYPSWRSHETSISFSGTLLPHGLTDNSGNGTGYLNMPLAWGYADNWPNNQTAGELDLDWAVDNTGKPVSLTQIDFIKVYTGQHGQAGWLGEISTEITGFEAK